MTGREQEGYDYARGALKAVGRVAWPLIFAVLAFAYLVGVLNPVDTTDFGRFARSGMRVHVDAETGCHYLSPATGGITERKERDGRHYCRGRGR